MPVPTIEPNEADVLMRGHLVRLVELVGKHPTRPAPLDAGDAGRVHSRVHAAYATARQGADRLIALHDSGALNLTVQWQLTELIRLVYPSYVPVWAEPSTAATEGWSVHTEGGDDDDPPIVVLDLTGWNSGEFSPEAAIAAGHRLIEAGQHLNRARVD